MPVNHGIYQKIAGKEWPVFRYGIRQVFHALRAGAQPANRDGRQRAAQLDHHLAAVCSRFVFALQDLNRLAHEFAACHSHDSFPRDSMRIRFQAECLADHALTYLNTIIDDVAIATALSTGLAGKGIDGMGSLRGDAIRSDPALTPVKTLLDELDKAGSWWELGFKTKQGGRQLLIHNQHLVEFQVSAAADGPFQATAFLMPPFEPHQVRVQNFFDLLRSTLADLFDWLDRLEVVLMTELRAKSSDGWQEIPGCPRIPLPVGYPQGVTQYETDCFPIPLCAGSDPLPWTINVQSQ